VITGSYFLYFEDNGKRKPCKQSESKTILKSVVAFFLEGSFYSLHPVYNTEGEGVHNWGRACSVTLESGMHV
jgi:hypothetical protein